MRTKAHGYRNTHKCACSLMSTAGQIHYNSFPLRPVFYTLKSSKLTQCSICKVQCSKRQGQCSKVQPCWRLSRHGGVSFNKNKFNLPWWGANWNSATGLADWSTVSLETASDCSLGSAIWSPWFSIMVGDGTGWKTDEGSVTGTLQALSWSVCRCQIRLGSISTS